MDETSKAGELDTVLLLWSSECLLHCEERERSRQKERGMSEEMFLICTWFWRDIGHPEFYHGIPQSLQGMLGLRHEKCPEIPPPLYYFSFILYNQTSSSFMTITSSTGAASSQTKQRVEKIMGVSVSRNHTHTYMKWLRKTQETIVWYSNPVPKHLAKIVYRGVEVKLHVFWTLALDEEQRSDSRSGHSNPGRSATGIHAGWATELVWTWPSRESNPVTLVRNHCIDRGTPAIEFVSDASSTASETPYNHETCLVTWAQINVFSYSACCIVSFLSSHSCCRLGTTQLVQTFLQSWLRF